MKLLAIDTATERCSVALLIDEHIVERATETPRGHADLVLPMVEAVLAESGLTLRQLDGLAYGRGPGAFTGVRIAVGVAQGLAFGAQLRQSVSRTWRQSRSNSRAPVRGSSFAWMRA